MRYAHPLSFSLRPPPLLAGVLLLLLVCIGGGADPQTNLLNLGCSQYNATNPSAFISTLNSTIADVISNSSSANNANYFATAHPHATEPVYALAQCRPYLTPSDCASCLANASRLLSRCGAANGARAILDGCFLRYESAEFFGQASAPGSFGICGNRTDPNANGVFMATVEELVADLSVAVPRIQGFYAATEKGGAYAMAQCGEDVGESGCANCLSLAYANVKGCPPAADGRAVDAGCFMRYSNTPFFAANQSIDLDSYLKSDSGNSRRTRVIIGVSVGVGGLSLVVLLFFLWMILSRRPRKERKGDILGATELQGPMNFRYRDLKVATKNFSEENKLGEGGFGDVYKGVLKNGKIVAIKKLIITQTRKAKADFQTEVKLISNVHHRNLVRLLGCSSKGPNLLLVYEYMANSSLDKFVFGEKRGTLNWKQRFDIIVGMARGLAYLHEEFHVCIIHRDIKSSNILVDDNFQAKIADFGLARLLPHDQSHLSTKFAGTLGYTAPEYAIHGQLSEKVDAYSFGVVVLELVSGRKSNDISLVPTTQYLLEWAWNLYEEHMLLDLVDESLDPKEYIADEVERVIEIALLCTQSTVASRPTMSEVVVLLLSNSGSVLHPTRPTFIDSKSRVREDISTSTASPSASNAAVSVSQLSAR